MLGQAGIKLERLWQVSRVEWESDVAEETPNAEVDSSESEASDEELVVTSGRSGVLRKTLYIAVVVAALLVVVLGVAVVRVMPRAGEAPTTAAQAAINKAQARIDADPGSIDARLGLVSAYFEFELYDDALGVLDEAVSLEPTGTAAAWVEVAYGRVYQAKGDDSAAAAHYVTSLEYAPTFDALYWLGNLASEQGDDSAALDYWLQAIAVDSGNATLRVDIAAIYEEQGNYALALEQLNEAARYVPDDPDILAAIERVEANTP